MTPPSRLSRRGATAALAVVERAVGRARLARFSRWMWLEVRLDGVNDPSTNGEYELLRSACREASARGSGTFLDVGAHLGYWTEALIEAWVDGVHGGAALQIHAFEPSPGSYAALHDRVKATLARTASSGISTKLNDSAIGQAVKRANLAVLSPTGGTNTLVPFEDAPGDALSVQVTTLDEYARLAGLADIDFVKVDTEGNDLAVLEGARGLLGAHRVRWLQFEYNHRWVSSRTYLRDAFTLAESCGYRVGKITSRGIEAYPGWHPELETFREANYLLWHDALPPGVAVVPWWVK